MDNEKDLRIAERAPVKDEAAQGDSNGSRARNRTVMLTPEITNQVRSRFAAELDQIPAPPVTPPPSQFSARGSAGGYEEPKSSGGFHTPTGRIQSAPVAHSQGVSAPPQQVVTPPPPAPSADGLVWIKDAPVVGFLVSYDVNKNGDVYPLKVGRLIITNHAAANENVLVLNDETVSSMHAILRISNSGEIQILDQLSEYGTKIRRFGSDDEEILSGDKSSIDHGDVITIGSRTFCVCVVPRSGG